MARLTVLLRGNSGATEITEGSRIVVQINDSSLRPAGSSNRGRALGKDGREFRGSKSTDRKMAHGWYAAG